MDQVIVDFDLDHEGTFSFIDKQEMIEKLGMRPRDERATADYIIDLFVLAGALFYNKISTTQKLSIEDLILKMNEVEARLQRGEVPQSAKPTG